MGQLQILPEEVIEQIAAGEIIDQPASVVKELVENAIDAKATCIIVRLQKGGFVEICVEDNGIGMTPEEALLSLKRHATSKIEKVEDLYTLKTMGFRGEALASISAISKLEMKTSVGAEGFLMQAEAGQVLTKTLCAKKRGTTILARSLFYNVPARKAFQKSINASSAEITRHLMALSLSHYEIHFELWIDGRKTLFAPSVKEEGVQSQLQAKLRMLGKQELISRSTWITNKQDSWYIYGFLAAPEYAKKHRGSQYLFINRRWVFSPQVSAFVKEIYSTRIGEAFFPGFILFLEVPPQKIEVNVHPQKKEIRFQNFSEVRDILYQALQPLLEPKITYSYTATPIEKAFPSIQKPTWEEVCLPTGEEKKISEEVQASLPFSKEQYLCLEGSFFLYSQEGQLFLLDLKKLYENLFGRGTQKPSSSQKLSVPILLEFSSEDLDQLFLAEEKWRDLGFEMRKIGKTTLACDALPPFMGKEDLSSFFSSYLKFGEGFFPSEKASKWSMFIEKLCAKKKTFSWEEAKKLFQLGKAQIPDWEDMQIHLSSDMLSSLFKRKK